jgi:hypothetical protein
VNLEGLLRRLGELERVAGRRPPSMSRDEILRELDQQAELLSELMADDPPPTAAEFRADLAIFTARLPGIAPDAVEFAVSVIISDTAEHHGIDLGVT